MIFLRFPGKFLSSASCGVFDLNKEVKAITGYAKWEWNWLWINTEGFTTLILFSPTSSDPSQISPHSLKPFLSWLNHERLRSPYEWSPRLSSGILSPCFYILLRRERGGSRIPRPLQTVRQLLSVIKRQKRRHLMPLNWKRRNSFITYSNCRTAFLGWGESHRLKKIYRQSPLPKR